MFSTLRVQFDPIWSLPVVAAVTVLAGLTVWLGYRLAHGLPAQRRILLLTVRFTTLLVLLIAMLRPQLQWISPEGQKPEIWILADASRSMSVLDGTGGSTRRANLLQILESVDSPLNSLAEQVELKRFDFSESVAAVDMFGDNIDGPQTALGTVLAEAVRAHGQTPLAGLFLFSDGAQRAVRPFDLDPREPARELGELGVSLYPIPIGQTESSVAAVDVAVTEIQVDPVVFEKKRVPVQVNVRWSGAGGKKLRVRLLLEDRTGLRAGQSGPLKPIPNSEFSESEIEFEPRYRDGTQVVNLSFTPEIAGEYKLAAEVVPLENEVQTRNNVRETLLTVRKGGLRVAYFDIFRTEIKSVRQLNASEKMQIDFQLMPRRMTGRQPLVDLRWFEPGRYDVFILGDVSVEQMGAEAIELLAQRVEAGAGLMMLGGYHTYSAGGYAGTRLERFLPVALNPADKQPLDDFARQLQIVDDIQLQPTASGNREFVMQIAVPEENLQRWAELPPLGGATRIQARSDAVDVLATSKTGDDLIVAVDNGRSRIMCLAFDQTYLWAQAGFAEQHRRFWRQAILWLARKELDSDQPVWLTVSPKAIDPGGRVQLDYGARDEKQQPIEAAEFAVSMTLPDGTEQTLSGTPNELGESISYSETLLPGDYFVRVQARQGGNTIGFAAQSRFIVHDRDLELDYPIVDRSLLSELAQEAGLSTDSQVVNPETLDEFLKDYLERKPWQTGVDVVSSWNLWDGWPILLTFATLMTFEWILRKQGGLV